MKLLAINGKAGSGKDTVASMLEEEGFIQIAFADPMKRFVQDIFEFSSEQLWGSSEERNKPDPRSKLAVTDINHPVYKHLNGDDWLRLKNDLEIIGTSPLMVNLSPRWILQRLGTEWGRYVYSDVWVDYLLRQVDCLKQGGFTYDKEFGVIQDPDLDVHSIVVSDVRYINEWEGLKRNGFKVIRIKRSLKDQIFSSHSSEREQELLKDENFDSVIVNDGTIEQLRNEVFAEVSRLFDSEL